MPSRLHVVTMFSKQILVILIVYLASNLSPIHAHKEQKFFRSDYFYLEATHSFYKTHSYPKPFAEAKRTCSWEGASLWYPEDQKEYDAVISYWNRTQPVLWIHVGITDLLAKGVFETLDGKRVEDVYHKWRKGEPNNNKGIENCIVLHPNGEMVDVQCDREAPFFCKKTLQSLEWNHKCNMPDLGYTFNVESGSCYKLHPTPLNWTEAYNVCSAEQSYLAVINNWLEVDNLVKLVKTAQMSRVAGSYLRGLYHSGFHNKFNEGWKTVKGTCLNETLEWWGNPPTGAECEDQCGAMFYTGRLNQIDCGLKCFFICEHDVDQLSLTQQS